MNVQLELGLESMERWVPLSDFPEYEVSSFGRVRRATPGRRRPIGYVLKDQRHNGGYRFITLKPRDGKRMRKAYVHRLVALAFIGPPKAGQEVNHLNGDKTDNRVENLEWVTRLENVRHSIAAGLFVPGHSQNRRRGVNHQQSRLTEEQVIGIRAARESGMTHAAIGRLFAISRFTVADIVKGRSWTHLPPCKTPDLPRMGRFARSRARRQISA